MKKMREQEVEYRIISEGKFMLNGGVILTLLGIFVLVMLLTGNYSVSESKLVIAFLRIIFGIILIFVGGRNISHPEKSKYVRKNPYLLDQVNQLFSNLIYEDNNVYISDQVIANKKNIFKMTYLKDISSIYISKINSNYLMLENKNVKNTFEIKMSSPRHGQREKVIELLSKYCTETIFEDGFEEVPPLSQIENNNYRQF